MKIDLKKLCDELGLNYEIDEELTIRCSYCGYHILICEPDPNFIFFKTRISSDDKGKFCFSSVERLWNDEYNYDYLKIKLIHTIKKFKLEKIEMRKADLCKDF